MSTDWQTLRWIGGPAGHLMLLDQTRLPVACQEVACQDVESLREAIVSLRVRGAPAIGIAAAYGIVLGLQTAVGGDEPAFFARLEQVCQRLLSSRPTAVNLAWAVDRMRLRAGSLRSQCPPTELHAALWAEARAIHEEDRQICRAIGGHGATLLRDGMGVLTHCNAGGLATSEYGTALAVIYAAHAEGKRVRVFADETRPLLQGARLTAWELQQHGIDTTVICDSAAAHVMRAGLVQAVITGADRIAANGDTANKIGTYGLAQLARAHRCPFYVAAPCSTFDLDAPTGAAIPIECRDAREVTHGFGLQTAPEGIRVYNPAFDVTPAELITAFITQHGIVTPVDAPHIAALLTREC
jgi:methylthioribose-1-phosphate isomerase